jgi:hypothetical protein
MGIKKYMHGGNHHEAANYGLSSVYDKNRYSKKAQSYRRFKKGGQVLDVYSSKGEKKGKGVNGRELYKISLTFLMVYLKQIVKVSLLLMIQNIKIGEVKNVVIQLMNY